MTGQQKLTATLGFWTCLSLVIGGVIGSGIFMKPSAMAAQLGSPVLLILVWVVAGIITLFGALSNAEVAAMIPETGGQYVFFQKMYGRFVAFMYGWSALVIFNSGGVASMAYVIGTYLEYFIALPRFSPSMEQGVVLHIPIVGDLLPLDNFGVKAVTILLVMGLTWANVISTRIGGSIQVISTVLKFLAIALVVSGAMFAKSGSVANFYTASDAIQPEGWALVGAVVAALSGAFWAFDGWNNITFVAGEIKNPQRNIPRALLFGLLTCIVIYVGITLAFLYVLPIDEMASSGMVASVAANRVLGAAGGGIIALMVVVCVFGATNANILATARVTYAMGEQKQFFGWVAKVSPHHQTPSRALWLHGGWACILVVSGSFDILTDMLIFVSWLFYALGAFGIFVLRRKMPDTPRPYRVWGYPFVPAIFVAFSLFFVTTTLWNDIYLYITGQTRLINSMLGLLLAGSGVPFYFYFARKYKE